ncbi:MAG: GNAT family N-acetyltransferase [Bacteroidales bacterium]|nr:GNAT family N-acetyltransferase [Bacteroidales bacterium]MCM1146670.1 GNAT family N-acetyltransferase [Bacteroidales bacterium]MCM1206060.1 GNAT family N-acetyltransferase [Bacillota bacterium]MCM1511037.1 GNAT family N-acetyltransferase [Clostridium sp.]
MMDVVRYAPERMGEWDSFVETSKNGTFLFLRGYMDYHSDRFADHSLMVYDKKGTLAALLPANEVRQADGTPVLHSHQGLTYGGLVLGRRCHTADAGEIFLAVTDYLRKVGFRLWHYKQIPSVYNLLPADEDSYWLWRMGAETENCSVMTAVDLRSCMKNVSPRKRTYRNKLLREGYTVEKGASLTDFWQILTENLRERFGAEPVHSLEEMTLLQGRFPGNIVCCTVKAPDGSTAGGTVLFITRQTVRTQYISASPEGKRVNALDFLMLTLMEEFSGMPQYRYFEFGTSMAEDNAALNDGLVLQKEGFGGSCVACRRLVLRL